MPGLARRILKRSPLAPALGRLRVRRDMAREGLRLLIWTRLGSFPSRRVRSAALRRSGMRLDPKATVYGWRDIRRPERIEIGPGAVIGFWATLDGRLGIKIGRDVNISSEAALMTLQHDPDAPDFGTRGGPIVVEERAWISFRATILPGVTIGRGAIVAANATVTKDVEPFTIVAGTPAKPIGKRSEALDYHLDGPAPWFV
jgi:carbonic anhydrase/acetyltransferase-like protein (isoleucine patch superfamily)